MWEGRVGGLYVFVYRGVISIIGCYVPKKRFTKGRMLKENLTLYRAEALYCEYYDARPKGWRVEPTHLNIEQVLSQIHRQIWIA